MAELDEPGDEPNFDLFGSFGTDFFSDDELLSGAVLFPSFLVKIDYQSLFHIGLSFMN